MMNDPDEIMPETAVATRDEAPLAPTGGGEIGDLLRAAIDKDVPVESMEKLVGLYERMADRTARQQFNAAFARFKADCPQPRKTAQSHHGTYTPLDELERCCGPHLRTSGFSWKWDCTATDSMMTVVCHLIHEGGHTETSTYACPITTRAGMSDQDKYASANAWARRLSFISVLGITSTDGDDAHSANLSRISDKQVADLDSLIDEVKADRRRFLKHARVERLEDILTEQLPELVRMLEAKRK